MNFFLFNIDMAADEKIEVTCPECPDFPDSLNLEASYMDRKIYLAGCALQAHIRNHTEFEKGHYPYDKVAGICARWAEAVLNACGAGGSSQGDGFINS